MIPSVVEEYLEYVEKTSLPQTKKDLVGKMKMFLKCTRTSK
jgi:hypothetical protein